MLLVFFDSRKIPFYELKMLRLNASTSGPKILTWPSDNVHLVDTEVRLNKPVCNIIKGLLTSFDD